MQRNQKNKHAVNADTNGNHLKMGGGGALNNIDRPNNVPDRKEEAESSLTLRQAAKGFSVIWLAATVGIIAFIAYTFVVHGAAMQVRALTIDAQQVELSDLYDSGCFEMCTKIEPLTKDGKTIIHFMDDNAHAYEKTIDVMRFVIMYLLITLGYVLIKAFEVIKRSKEKCLKK